MSSLWYYTHGDGRQVGPISTEQLKQLAAEGQLLPGDLLRKKGTPRWRLARKARELFQSSEPAPGVIAKRPPACARATGVLPSSNPASATVRLPPAPSAVSEAAEATKRQFLTPPQATSREATKEDLMREYYELVHQFR